MRKFYRLGCPLAVVLLGWSCGEKPDVYSVSVPNLKVDADASIVSMQISITGGTVQAMQNVPVGWSISINNDIPPTSQITGVASGSTASLSADEFKRITFLVRRKETEDIALKVSGSFVTNKWSGGSKKVEAGMEDFALVGVQ